MLLVVISGLASIIILNLLRLTLLQNEITHKTEETFRWITTYLILEIE